MKHQSEGMQKNKQIHKNNKETETKNPGRNKVCHEVTTNVFEGRIVCCEATTEIFENEESFDSNIEKMSNINMNECANVYERVTEQKGVSSER